MQTIGALIGSKNDRNHRAVKELPEGSIGIELELEGGNFGNVPGWDVHNDGSLRNGVEYVFKGPQGGDAALASILAMGEAFKGMKPRPTFRCSTHCHLDVRDMTIPQVQKLIAAYCIMEDVMFDHCEEYRRFSNFCTPYFVSDRLVRYAGTVVRKDEAATIDGWRAFPKYSSLNLQPIGNFGSVEFRGSHAMTSGEELLGLAQRMLHLRRLVLESAPEVDLKDFIQTINKMNPVAAFPTGLMKGYQRDQELADTCYANSLFFMSSLNQGMNMEVPRQNWFNHDRVPPQRVPGGGQVADQLEIRTRGFNSYGLFTATPTVSYQEAVRICASLRNIQGIRAPGMNTLFRMDRPLTHDQTQRLGQLMGQAGVVL